MDGASFPYKTTDPPDNLHRFSGRLLEETSAIISLLVLLLVPCIISITCFSSSFFEVNKTKQEYNFMIQSLFLLWCWLRVTRGFKCNPLSQNYIGYHLPRLYPFPVSLFFHRRLRPIPRDYSTYCSPKCLPCFLSFFFTVQCTTMMWELVNSKHARIQTETWVNNFLLFCWSP